MSVFLSDILQGKYQVVNTYSTVLLGKIIPRQESLAGVCNRFPILNGTTAEIKDYMSVVCL